MSTRWFVRFAFGTLTFLHWSPGEVQAKFFLITHGDTISSLGTAKFNLLGLPSNQVGYKYGYFGIFWIDVWNWGGEFCVYENFPEKRYWSISREQAAQLLGVSADSLSPPFNYRFPLGLLILGGLGVIGILATVLTPKQKPDPRLSDPRYQEAIRMVADLFDQEVRRQHEENPDLKNMADHEREEWAAGVHKWAIEGGVQHLVSQGIEREEAEKNLRELIEGTVS